MKIFIVISALLAAALALPIDNSVSVDQDTLGNYKVNINTLDLTKIEERHADGSVSGSYSYPSSDGSILRYQYIADKDGFRIISGPLPVAPVDVSLPVAETPEVINARNAHFALVKSAGISAQNPFLFDSVAPVAPIAPAAVPHGVSVHNPFLFDRVAPVAPTAPTAVPHGISVHNPFLFNPVAPVAPILRNLALPTVGFQQAPLFPNVPAVVSHEVPLPVEDTPEVKAAKAAHFAAHDEALKALHV